MHWLSPLYLPSGQVGHSSAQCRKGWRGGRRQGARTRRTGGSPRSRVPASRMPRSLALLPPGWPMGEALIRFQTDEPSSGNRHSLESRHLRSLAHQFRCDGFGLPIGNTALLHPAKQPDMRSSRPRCPFARHRIPMHHSLSLNCVAREDTSHPDLKSTHLCVDLVRST